MHDPTTCDRCYEFDIWRNRSASPALRGFLEALKAEHIEAGENQPTITFVAKPVSITPNVQVTTGQGIRITSTKGVIQ